MLGGLNLERLGGFLGGFFDNQTKPSLIGENFILFFVLMENFDESGRCSFVKLGPRSYLSFLHLFFGLHIPPIHRCFGSSIVAILFFFHFKGKIHAL